jgi:hypothetical protein
MVQVHGRAQAIPVEVPVRFRWARAVGLRPSTYSVAFLTLLATPAERFDSRYYTKPRHSFTGEVRVRAVSQQQ